MTYNVESHKCSLIINVKYKYKVSKQYVKFAKCFQGTGRVKIAKNSKFLLDSY